LPTAATGIIWWAMPDAVSSPRLLPRPVLAVAAVIGVLVAATLTLWAHYGTALFYEMILAGFAACF
jgi:preprotein translocase subunit Sec61beta